MTFLRNDKIASWFYVILFFFIVIGLWEFIVDYFRISVDVLPPPSRIGAELKALLSSKRFWDNYIFTLHEVLLGYGLAIVFAFILAVLISQFRPMRLGLMPYIVAFQAIPTIALAPIVQLWFGYQMTSKVIMAALIAFFPMLINFIAGLQAARHDEVQLLKAFGATRYQILMKVRIPNAFPFIFAGLDLGIIFALIGAIVAEFVGSEKGVIRILLQYEAQFNIAGMFAVLITLSITGMVLHGIVGYAKRCIVFWEGE